MVTKKNLTPQQVITELNKYIIGQEDAKKTVAIALRDRWRRSNVQGDIRDEIVPSNILMKGPTGTGKSELGRRMAKICAVPFVKVEATQYTETGYVGKDVKDIIGALAENAVNIVKREKRKHLKHKIEDLVDKIILDILIPSIKTKAKKEEKTTPENNEETREIFLQKIKKGDLDNRFIELEMQEQPNSIGLISGGALDETMLTSFNTMMSKIIPIKTSIQKVKIKEAKKLLFDSELERHMDIKAIHKEAITKAEEGIVFLDEVDKIIGSPGEKGGPEVSRKGVQNNLLPIIEGTVVNTKIGRIKTDHILFIAAGAFHNNKPTDLMPEFQGRFPARVELNSLTEENYAAILENPDNSLTKQQQALLQVENVKLTFTKKSIKAMAKATHILNQEGEDIGARRLRTVMMQVLNDILFDVPEKINPGSEITIDDQYVNKKLEKLIKEKTSTDYII